MRKIIKHSAYFRDYPQIQPILINFGVTGYGILWKIIEGIKHNPNERILIPVEPFLLSIATIFNVQVEQVQEVYEACLKYGALRLSKEGLYCDLVETEWQDLTGESHE